MATAATKVAEISKSQIESAIIPVKEIAPSRTNPRKHFAQDGLAELAASIKTQGVMSPLLVRKMPVPAPVHELMDELLRQPEKSEAKYEIVTGERRWRAAQLAGLERVPCIVREMDDRSVLEAQIAENLQRSDITPLEEGAAYRAWLKVEGEMRKAAGAERVTVDDLAARIGKSRRYVYDKLQLLDLGELATRALERGAISAAYASELVRLKPELQDHAVKSLADGEISSVKELREWIAAKRDEAPVALPKRKAAATIHYLPGARLTPWAGICSAGTIDKGTLRGLLYQYEGGKFKLAEREQMDLGRGAFYAVTAAVSSGEEGTIELELTRAFRRSEWTGRTFTYNNKKREPDGRLSYTAIRVRCHGREWVLTEDDELRLRKIGAKSSSPREAKRAEWTPTAIKREIGDALEERFGRDFRSARIARARKLGEWIVLLRMQAPAQSSGARQKARSKRRKR